MKYEWNVIGVIKKIGNCGNADVATFPEPLDVPLGESHWMQTWMKKAAVTKGWGRARGHRIKGTRTHSVMGNAQRIKRWKWPKQDALPRHRKDALSACNNSQEKTSTVPATLKFFLHRNKTLQVSMFVMLYSITNDWFAIFFFFSFPYTFITMNEQLGMFGHF